MTTRDPSRYEPPSEHTGGRSGSAGPRRRARTVRPRLRTLLPLAVAAWVVLELWLLLLLGDAAGGLTVFLLLAAGFVLGAAVIKRAGRRAWQALARTLQPPGTTQREPARTPSGGNAPAMLGGMLLMLPGLLSDAAGLLCLFPPTASLLRRAADRWVRRHAPAAGAGTLGEALHQARTAGDQARIHRPDGKVVQGEVIRDHDPHTERPRDPGPRDGATDPRRPGA
ncbi:FxsA family protein [Streptomyces sp. JJ66]|uniref:FxsA family membrane protein n=1 Tax=Streptomyces sp. JJ66 TaxID=2803843 RepID=UPI001C595FD9|nr:FxsA family membrane protein [Streptomyces sp. JJ66]MBW1603622.1 FxsA family protein [Streptomyces sp. JJ66]